LAPANAFGICIRTQVTGPSKPVLVEKKSADPGERIDAFAFFYCPDAVLAKTVLTSRRSRAAVGGICFSADQLVPRISRPLLCGTEHTQSGENGVRVGRSTLSRSPGDGFGLTGRPIFAEKTGETQSAFSVLNKAL
jgi:hypothetical protein